MMTSIQTDDIQQALNTAAAQLQAHFAQQTGDVYRVEDLQQALTNWLELSIEQLAEDAVFHAVEGDRSYAFNRAGFISQLKRIKPVEVQEVLVA